MIRDRSDLAERPGRLQMREPALSRFRCYGNGSPPPSLRRMATTLSARENLSRAYLKGHPLPAENCHVPRDHPDHHPAAHALGRPAHLVAQRQLGIPAERRDWPGARRARRLGCGWANLANRRARAANTHGIAVRSTLSVDYRRVMAGRSSSHPLDQGVISVVGINHRRHRPWSRTRRAKPQ